MHSGLTLDQALKTIHRAAERSGPGTIIALLPGTYAGKVSLSYEGLNPWERHFRLQGCGEDPGRVIIDCSRADFSWSGAIDVLRTSRVTLSNLSIRDSPGMGVFVDACTGVRIRGVHTENTDYSGVYVGLSRDVLVEGVEVRRGCLLDPESGELAQENITIRGVEGFEVRGCRVHQGAGQWNGGEGICVKGNSSFGRIHDNAVFDLPGDVGIYLGAGNNEPGKSTHHIAVYSNRVQTDTGIGVSSETGGVIEDVDIFNNIVKDGRYAGITITGWREDSGGPPLGMRRRIRVFNNTIHVMATLPEGQTGALQVQCSDPDCLENIVLANNLISGEGSLCQIRVHPDVASVVTIMNCLYQGQEKIDVPTGLLVDCFEADPSFIGYGPDPFDLGAGSPAIDAGADVWVDIDFDSILEALPFDLLGWPRPIDGLPAPDGVMCDIGAYERQ
jgi:hypothetical protein